MKKIIIAAALFSIGFKSAVNAQNAPQTKFFRPSMTTTYIKSSNQQIEKIYGGFSKTPMEARFDLRAIPNGSLVVNLPAKPVMPETVDPLQMKKAMADYKKATADWQTSCKKEITKVLAPIGRKVFGDMLGRDANGDMSWAKIMEAAAYSATDGQALSAGASKNMDNVYQEIAEQLLSKVYITVYDVKNLKTYEQVYDEKDAAAKVVAEKAKKEYKPAKRVLEGWQIEFDYSVYKLVWNDSIQNLFGNDAWLSADITDPSDRARRKSNFDNFVFPFELATQGSSIASATQSKDPGSLGGVSVPRKSMDQLLEELPLSMQDDMVSKGGRVIEDFKMRAPVFQESPVQVKLGTKEGLYYDERFFAYEIVVDKNGNKVKKRRAVLRASKIADNAVVAQGNSPASTFRQEGGKNIYQGTLVELKEDFGLGINVGYGLMDKFVGGVNMGLEIRIPSILKGKESWAKYLRGLYLNGNLGYNILPEDEVWANYPDDKYSGSSMALGVSLSRETYIMKKGNLYLMPEIGGGILSVTLNEFFSDGTALNGSSMFVNGGLGIGLHVSPMISIFAKAGFNMRLGDATWTDENDTEWDVSGNGEFSSKSGFNKLNGMTTPVSAGLRFRF